MGAKHVLPCAVYKVCVKSDVADDEVANSVLCAKKVELYVIVVLAVKFDHKVKLSTYCTWDQCRGEVLRSRM